MSAGSALLAVSGVASAVAFSVASGGLRAPVVAVLVVTAMGCLVLLMPGGGGRAR